MIKTLLINQGFTNSGKIVFQLQEHRLPILSICFSLFNTLTLDTRSKYIYDILDTHTLKPNTSYVSILALALAS